MSVETDRYEAVTHHPRPDKDEALYHLPVRQAPGSGQVGGDHYRDTRFQPWEVMRDWFTPEEYRGFLKGCLLKRLKRWKPESGTLDLLKMKQEIDELIIFEEFIKK